MPKTKKESLFFTTIVCFSMVFSMSLYNLVLHEQLSWSHLLGGLVPGFLVAFLVDVFVVANAAKKIAFSLPINREKQLHMVVAVSSCMVLGMVFFMSIYGVVVQTGITEEFFSNYIGAFSQNLVMALPLQLLIVGPICRLILKKSRQANWLRQESVK
ncbi:DUF2798 domain-containing protein [Enterococcus sp. DIV0242_7C1]|uniref:Integral membrane protein n=1 Tax=Candidatus Enterococcus dunnyi TaxID=1834192 RepID=A0A200J7J6_9ENTE|nr:MULTISPECIES: DUF2798 domain-containing protein [unclassified Enterococcus]MBO0470754.1 DUF2798 domain-containing protein [Enterococcus sp. DIV0242_7C1]OUZ33202.1 hypothetical protein A5889_001912 [Enterococcus sp. 9D6_DIV0238]